MSRRVCPTCHAPLRFEGAEVVCGPCGTRQPSFGAPHVRTRRLHIDRLRVAADQAGQVLTGNR